MKRILTVMEAAVLSLSASCFSLRFSVIEIVTGHRKSWRSD